jgi:hypothetical protein
MFERNFTQRKIAMKATFLSILSLLFLSGCDMQNRAPQHVTSPPTLDFSIDRFGNDPAFIRDMHLAPSLTGDDACQKTWDIYWEWAKKGSLLARNGLLFSLTMGDMKRPGATDDAVSRLRDYAILGVYSLGYPEMLDLQKASLAALEPVKPSRKFFDCVENNPSQHCAQIAQDDGMVPAFETYAAEIDHIIAQGKTPTCRAHHNI